MSYEKTRHFYRRENMCFVEYNKSVDCVAMPNHSSNLVLLLTLCDVL